jgi:Rrf2 family protein
MRVTTRVRYGLRAMLQIADHYQNGPVPISAISHTQEISAKYLEQIVGNLRRHGILASRKGVRGGYFLTRTPAEISLWEVISALDGETELVDCVAHPEICERADDCCTRVIWSLLGHRLRDFWQDFSLQDLLDQLPTGSDGLLPCAHARDHAETPH